MARILVPVAALLMIACGAVLGVDPLDVDPPQDAGASVDGHSNASPPPSTPPSPEPAPPDAGVDATCTTTAPHTPGVATQTAPNGEGEGWGSLSKIEVQDDVGATNALSYGLTSDNSLQVSQLIQATDFGFQIPAGATIAGVTFGLRAKGFDGGIARDRVVSLVNVPNGGANLAKPEFYGDQSAFQDRTYGGDTWGLALTPAIVNDPAFGVGFSMQRGSATPVEFVAVDVMTLAVTYCVQ